MWSNCPSALRKKPGELILGRENFDNFRIIPTNWWALVENPLSIGTQMDGERMGDSEYDLNMKISKLYLL